MLFLSIEELGAIAEVRRAENLYIFFCSVHILCEGVTAKLHVVPTEFSLLANIVDEFFEEGFLLYKGVVLSLTT